MKKLKTVFYSFEVLNNKYDVLEIKASNILAAQFQGMLNKELYDEYGDSLFLVRNSILINENKPSFEEVLNIPPSDYLMILEVINKQIEL